MSDNTGGPAFPKIQTLGPCGKVGRMEDGYVSVVSVGGMTLLDWFAGQALSGLSSSWYDRHKDDLETLEGSGPREIAQAAYAHADAMLAEKARREATGKYGLQVRDHFPDAGKMAELEEENRELVEALRKFVEAGSGWPTHEPTQADAFKLAHAVLTKHQTHKKEAGHE